MHNVWSRRRKGDEPPIELRFVDLFMILLTTLIFISVILSVISAGIHGTEPPEAPRIATCSTPAALEPLRVLAPSVLLPRAEPEEPYRAELRMAGGHPPYRWRLVNGKLPSGVSWSPQGLVQGTPEDVEATGEDFSFSMRAMDAAGRQVVQQFTLAVRPPEKSVWRKRIERAVQVLYVLFIIWWFWRGFYFPGAKNLWRQRQS